MIFLTVFWKIWGNVKPKNALASGAPPDLTRGTYRASLDPLAKISIILFEVITEMLRKKQFWTCNTKFPIALKNYLC